MQEFFATLKVLLDGSEKPQAVRLVSSWSAALKTTSWLALTICKYFFSVSDEEL